MDKAKPFDIPKREVWEAFKRVKANQGAAGVDGQSIAEFEANLSGNLYKLWNRMSSGSYFPRRCGGSIFQRQMAGRGHWVFQLLPTASPRRSPGATLSRSWSRSSTSTPTATGPANLPSMPCARLVSAGRYDWVLDLDVRSYFDSIDWELMLKAVRHHTDCPWVLLYIERWLKAPVQMEDGSIVPRMAGTPQGGVISPLLANLFLHYAFDQWMARTYPHIPFERYADDAICHCRSAEEAQALWKALADRLAVCKLALHPEKTKIVYCKDVNRRGDYPNQSFDFLGFAFRARKTVWHGHRYVHGFRPAVSPKALKAISRTIRGWALHHRSDKSLQDLAAIYNSYIRGWINYYGQFYRKQLRPTLLRIDTYLVRWARWKFKRLRRRHWGAREWLARVRCANPTLFSHWRFLYVGSRTSEAV